MQLSECCLVQSAFDAVCQVFRTVVVQLKVCFLSVSPQHVVQVCSDVPEGCTASLFRVTEYCRWRLYVRL